MAAPLEAYGTLIYPRGDQFAQLRVRRRVDSALIHGDISGELDNPPQRTTLQPRDPDSPRHLQTMGLLLLFWLANRSIIKSTSRNKLA